LSSFTGSSPEEDAENKPYRPIPSKLITLENAKILRKLMPIFNLGLALYLNVFPAALGITAFTILHNEVGTGNHWFGKQSCTAALYAFFEIGATAVAG